MSDTDRVIELLGQCASECATVSDLAVRDHQIALGQDIPARVKVSGGQLILKHVEMQSGQRLSTTTSTGTAARVTAPRSHLRGRGSGIGTFTMKW